MGDFQSLLLPKGIAVNDGPLTESYEVVGRETIRTVRAGTIEHISALPVTRITKSVWKELKLDPDALFDLAWLSSKADWQKPDLVRRNPIRVVDLFCGIGGISLGVKEAASALGIHCEVVFANDIEQSALASYALNFSPRMSSSASVTALFDGELEAPLTTMERRLRKDIGHVDILVGGPPCQGHSDLNNHTRRADPKNELYFKMARAAKVLKPSSIIIENVPGVKHDTGSVVERTRQALVMLGYKAETFELNASEFGVAQARKRFFLVASKAKLQHGAVANLKKPVRPLAWAIGDLASSYESKSIFDSSAQHSETNQRRIRYLFDNDIYELPDAERPDCHRLKPHSYKSVYGRMYWDRPSPTITGGFGSTGQGRFVHSLFPRTLTPHEAARVQFFPDFFQFDHSKRRDLQQVIGNAVPPRMGYVLAMLCITSLLESGEFAL